MGNYAKVLYTHTYIIHMYIYSVDPKVTTTECGPSHNIHNIQVNTIKNINLQLMFDTWKTESNAWFDSGWCYSLGLHQKITSADRECHLGHFLTSNGFISITKHGFPITSWQGRAIQTAMEGNIIFTIKNVALWYEEFHSIFKRTIIKGVTVSFV
jgi:hypothetical protein